jgi:predicted dehydrogenase
VHMLDLAAWYFGPIDEVKLLWQDTLLPERTVAGESVRVTTEDFSVVRLQAGSVQILLESDLATPSYMQHIDIQGDNGSIFSSILHYLPTVVYCKEGRGIYDQGNNMYTFPQVNVFERELRHFLESIRAGKKPGRNGLEDSIHIVELVEGLRAQM